jgi:hypothetical protein
MKIILIFLTLCASYVNSSISTSGSLKESISLLQDVCTSDISQKYIKKFGDKFKSLGKIAEKAGPFLGPAGNILSFILFFTEQAENTEDFYANITKEFNVLKEKLNAISEQISSLDDKITTSSKEIISEVRFQNFFELIEDIAAEEQKFELIINSYSSNASAIISHLSTFIDDYMKKNLEFKLVNFLESGKGFSTSLIDKVISLYREYQTNKINTPSSSLAKTVNDIYTTVLTTITRGFTIIDMAVNTKIALTGIYHPEDKEFLKNNKNSIYGLFSDSIQKSFAKLNDRDYEMLINLKENGSKNPVQLINVLQTFIEYENLLHGGLDTCSDDCSHFNNREYNGNGCNGVVRYCKWAFKELTQ